MKKEKMETFVDLLKAAREKYACASNENPSHFVGEAEFYCSDEDCPAREVTIVIKEHDKNCPPEPKCPFCRKKLKIHRVIFMWA